jgi:hypothetical protein
MLSVKQGGSEEGREDENENEDGMEMGMLNGREESFAVPRDGAKTQKTTIKKQKAACK